MATDFITDVIDIPTLIGFVRERTADALPLARFLPPLAIPDIEYELQNIDTTRTGLVARYRSWDTAPPLVGRAGISRIAAELAPLGLSRKLNERDMLSLERIRAGVADATDRRIEDTIYNDAEELARAVQNRVTIAMAELLTTGKVTLESSTTLAATPGSGPLVADFDVPGAHLNVVPTGAAFSNTGASVPVTEIKAWQAIFRANNNGRNPDLWLTSSDVVADLSLNAQVRALSPANADGSTRGIVDETTVAQVMRAHGIAPIVAFDDEAPTLAGTLSAPTWGRIFGARLFIGILLSGLGNTLYGPTADAATMAGNGTIQFTDAPGIIAFVESSVRPAGKLTTAEAVSIPALRNPNGIFVATV
jgi:hypothetical protein